MNIYRKHLRISRIAFVLLSIILLLFEPGGQQAMVTAAPMLVPDSELVTRTDASRALASFAPHILLGGSAESSVTASNTTPIVGDSITVDINIDVSNVDPPDDALGSFSATLHWNPSVLTYDSDSGIQAGFLGIINTSSAASGQIIFNGVKPAGAAGNNLILSITFQVEGAGSSDLDLEYYAMAAAITYADLLPLLTVNDDSLTVGLRQYTLEVNKGGSGSVTLDPVGDTYDEGTNVQVTAVPADGWQFDGWSGDLSGTTNPASITMDSNKIATAKFTKKENVYQIFLPLINVVK